MHDVEHKRKEQFVVVTGKFTISNITDSGVSSEAGN